jgi:outer membrane protein OmpA-like peptidoglycan-associated protein
MRNCYSIILFLMLAAGTSYSQSLRLPGADLQTAMKIEVNQTYSFPQGPKGYGKLKEFQLNSKRSPYIFREERNSSWLLINIPYQGILTFDLTPHDLNNDYDWMLFKSASDLGNPLRSNNARNNKSTFSKTGLKTNSKTAFVKPGPGNNYSIPLEVKAGNKLYLIVDNIYGGKGFDISIRLNQNYGGKTILLEGTVKDKYTLSNLSAEVLVEDDSTGALIGKVKSDPVTGKYKLKVPSNRSLNATAYHSNYMFTSREVLANQNTEVNFNLDTIAFGKKLVLYNIHFYPNKDQILPSSYPELERLINFMTEHSQQSIKIVGHTNNNVFASAKYLQQLSFARAIAVKKYLLDHAISAKRISCAGMGGKEPLVNTRDSVLGMKNLRVEVVLERDIVR